ncbi:MAG: Gfo/Idh/MocA family oxidoreductase [Thermoguttaceae bacterium]|nr:Gfo/Idh/MocA family oxidoreductase [Thermoguttaceae bacterium]MDW8078222.1 Gfo/Idh/MocA family oxidoreductase [Thermoguttaceae bacterium]
MKSIEVLRTWLCDCEENDMLKESLRRRQLLEMGLRALAGGGVATSGMVNSALAAGFRSPNDRPGIALIGAGGRGLALAQQAGQFGNITAICDADLQHAAEAQKRFGEKIPICQDYREVLERKDVDVVINATPDHWHTIINVAALRAGKDVYTEKPLTLTFEEGVILRRVVQETGGIVQVGTQQRSEAHFRLACQLVRSGWIGTLKQVVVWLPFWNTKGGPFPPQPVPPHLNWDLYQGQAPERPYHPMRTHFNFRWWFEYAGGIITDWGQHHLDIAYWGADLEQSGPLEVEARGFFPNRGAPDCFNNPDRFVAHIQFPGPIEMWFLVARDEKYLQSAKQGDISPEEDRALFAGVPAEIAAESRNGILFIGDSGRIFVNRGGAYGKPVEDFKAKPDVSLKVALPVSDDHMGNFFQAVASRQQPICTVDVAHRVITTSHLANIAMRLGRKIRWDPAREEILDDKEAASWLRRPQRLPYVLEA